MKILTKALGATLLTSTLLLTGCSPYSLVYSDVYNSADLSEFKTFRIVTPDDGQLPPGMEMVTYYNIAAAVREQMVERGYTESADSPMLINIGLTVKNENVAVPYTQTVPLPTPPPYPPLPRPIPGPVPPPGPAHHGMVPVFIYPRAYYWPQQYTTITQWVPEVYREGVLTVDFVDIKNMVPLYSASVATILDNGDSQLRNLSGIAAAVKVLFSKYPVPLLPQYK